MLTFTMIVILILYVINMLNYAKCAGLISCKNNILLSMQSLIMTTKCGTGIHSITLFHLIAD